MYRCRDIDRKRAAGARRRRKMEVSSFEDETMDEAKQLFAQRRKIIEQKKRRLTDRQNHRVELRQRLQLRKKRKMEQVKKREEGLTIGVHAGYRINRAEMKKPTENKVCGAH